MDILLLIFLFVVKHFIVDFVWQTQEEIEHKGTYLDYRGITHSVKHGLGTLIVLWAIGASFELCLLYGALDLVIHYHVDWTKQYLAHGLTVANPKFWHLLGLDQMLHYLTYILFVATMLV